jgi:anti-sigma regulatory factor (Ser/Thr protein kinase)
VGALLITPASTLVDRWLAGATPLHIVDEAGVAVARDAAREAGARAGLDVTGRERLAMIASELGHNLRRHAGRGSMAILDVTRAGVAGLEIIAADRGTGIADPTMAFAGRASSLGSNQGAGLGVGLSAVMRQADEIDVDVRWGEGTCVRARVFTAPVAKSEVAIVSRSHPDEPVCGDDATFLRGDRELLLSVVDGLGHGPQAREAAVRAIVTVHGASHLPLPELLTRCDGDLAGTRGAVMALARVDLDGAALEHAAVGNTTARVHESEGIARPLLSTAGTLGVSRPTRRLTAERVAFASSRVLTMVSDGIVTRLDLTGEPALVRRHPIVIAHHIMTRFARGTDDAIVLVAR